MSEYERIFTTADKRELMLYTSGYSIYSNFYRSPFKIEGQRYLTMEQWYQSMKAHTFGDTEAEVAILKTTSPRICKSIGWKIQNFDKIRWNQISQGIMLRGLTEKFKQNAKLQKLLLETESLLLVEASPYNDWWSSGLAITEDHTTYPGLNKMGQMLMCVRESIRHTK